LGDTGIVQSLPFASLWDRQKARYLLEDHVIGAAPSGNVFVQASLAAFARVPGPLAVLAVGNPQLSPEAAEGLPPLPAAETEAVEIAGLYPAAQLMTGAAAGQKEFLAGMRRSRVVHFGGHALGGEAPWDAYLLLAPDPRSGSSGAFYLHALDGENLTAIRAVVLAACGTARAAEARHDSAAGLGRPFLAAGVPNVIASLRDIDDEGSRHFFVAFHRALIADGDPLVALHRTQMAMVRSADAGRSHPASWAVFVSMGGLDRRSLGRLDRIPGSSEL
jgi:CHAT domain-containing protein